MALTPFKMLLFVAGGLMAGAGAAYYAGALDVRDSADLLPGPITAPQTDGEEVARVPESHETEPGKTQPQQEHARAAQDVTVPAFDLLRVERDGSMVVAGRAAPGAEVEVLNGSTILSTTESGPNGDFAAVLDEPLDPGEYNIVLRATSPDVTATSVETAIVSIPTEENGQVVALVQQPGAPSRLITRPPAEPPDSEVDEAAPESQITEASRPDAQPEGDIPAGEAFADAGTERPQGGAELGDAAPQNTARNEPSEGVQPDGQDVPASETSPFIEAVEIDGRHVFVAGTAKPGRQVRVYANDKLLGQTTVDAQGRFLIEAEQELPVGDYIVRADVLAEDGVTVIARAAVPFERREGEKMAAVAPSAGQTSPADKMPAQNGAASPAVDVEDGDVSTSESVSSDPALERRGTNEADRVTAARSSDAEEDHAATALAEGDDGANELAPALERVESSVIIRRGDTLWQISRRVYGRGMRYTTIYLANQEQIRDPDMIWPGQIFALPKRTDSGEEANLDAIADQAIKPENAASR